MGTGTVLEPIAVAPQPEPHPPISGFWRRFFAFVIDGMILGTIGMMLGAVFFHELVALDGWGRLIGLVVGTIYFGLQNSSLAGGRTLGKRVLGIRVVDAGGKPISPGISLLRSFIFLLPFQLNQAELPTGHLSPVGVNIVTTVQTAIIFVLGFWIIYLAVFNRRTRQSVHDLIAHTYVVRSGEGTVVAPKIWKGHWAISGAVVLAMLLSAVLLYQKLVKTPTMQGLLELQSAVSASGEFRTVGVTKGTMNSTSGSYTYLAVNARVTDDDDVDRAKEDLATLVLRKDPTALGTDRLIIVIVYGYDLGFASASRSWRDSRTIDEWRAALGPKLQSPAPN